MYEEKSTGSFRTYIYSLSDSSLATAFSTFLCDKIFEFAIQTWQTSLAGAIDNNTNSRDRIVGNGQILQWDLMSKINILRS